MGGGLQQQGVVPVDGVSEDRAMVERQVQMQHLSQRYQLHGLGIVPPLQRADVIHLASENCTGLTMVREGGWTAE